MSDRDLRELERRAYDSDEDFLRYSAARIRAGLGPVLVEIDGLRGMPRSRVVAAFLTTPTSAWVALHGDVTGRVDVVRAAKGADGHWRMSWMHGEQATDDNAKAEAERVAAAQLRAWTQHSNPPGRDEAIKAAWREWQAGDDLSLERLMGERERAGMTPVPVHPELKAMRVAAKEAGYKQADEMGALALERKRPTVKQAQAALAAELRGRGWRLDPQSDYARQGGRYGAPVFITPDGERRVTFLKSNLLWERGGRGNWKKDYSIHSHNEPMSVIDAVLRMARAKSSKPLMRDQWTDPMQNPPGADSEIRNLERAVKSGDAEAAFRMIQPEFGERYRTPSNLRNAGFGALVMWPRRVKRPKTGTIAGNLTAKPVVSEWYVRLIWPEKWERIVEVKSKKAALKLPEVYGLRTGFLNDKILVVEDYHEWAPVVGTTKAYFVDYPGLSARGEKVDKERAEKEAKMTPGDWTARMASNPPDKDVLYSLASLAQHGRTSTTIPALVATTGRPKAHVEKVVVALAQRGAVVVRGPLVIFDRRIIGLVVGAPAVRKAANPGADERRRALERQARREAETYGVAAEDTEAQKLLEADTARRTVPALGDRAYLRDILTAWGIGEHGTGWVSVGVASKGLQAVFKKAGIKASFSSSSYSMGSHISITTSYAAGPRMAALLGLPERGRAAGDGHVIVHPNARDSHGDPYADYREPGGPTLPAEYYQTYAEAVQKALGSKAGASAKKEAKREAKAAERASATTLDETYGDPVVGKRYLFDLSGRYYGVWEFVRVVPGGERGNLYSFNRVGKTGKLLSSIGEGNHVYLSEKDWERVLKAGQIKYGPTSNPGMATLGWATNPGKGLSFNAAFKRLKKLAKLGHRTMIEQLVAQTRPRDRDKLKAEIAHLFKQSNPRSSNPGKSLGRQQGSGWKTVSLETAIGRYQIDKLPGFKEALAHYRKFHKADPHSVRICTRKNSSGKNQALVVTDMGEVPETQYVVKAGKDSNKAGHHWVHKHREKGRGTNPSLVFDPVSGTMMIVGGTYKVTDWIRN